MLKRSKKFITSMLSSCLIMGIIPKSNITVNNESKSYKIDLNKINPVVEDLKELEEGFNLTDTVELVGSDTADAQGVKFLKDLLESNNIKVNLINKEENVNYNNTVIILNKVTIDSAHSMIESTVVELPEVSAEVGFIDDKGYNLSTLNDIEVKDHNVIEIESNVEDGALEKTIDIIDTVEVSEIDVKVYEEDKLKGIVEGFYGKPRTKEKSYYNVINTLCPKAVEDFKVFLTHNIDSGPKDKCTESQYISSKYNSFKNKLVINEVMEVNEERLIQGFKAKRNNDRNIIEKYSNKKLMARIDKHNKEALRKCGITVAAQKSTPFEKIKFNKVEGIYINEVYMVNTS